MAGFSTGNRVEEDVRVFCSKRAQFSATGRRERIVVGGQVTII